MLVVGGVPLGSIGLYVAGLAVALQASCLRYADHDAGRLAIAARLGAEPVDLNTSALESLDRDFDITVDSSGQASVLTALLKITGRAGLCTSTAAVVYRGQDVALPAHHMYRHSVTFKTGWVHTHVQLQEPLALILSGRLDPSPVNTAVVPWEQAIEALTRRFTKVIITRTSAAP